MHFQLTGDAHRYATSVLQHRLKEQIEPLQAYVTEQTDVIRDEADDHPQLGVKAERVRVFPSTISLPGLL